MFDKDCYEFLDKDLDVEQGKAYFGAADSGSMWIAAIK